MPSAQVSLAAIPFLPKALCRFAELPRMIKATGAPKGSNSHFPVKEKQHEGGNGSGDHGTDQLRDPVEEAVSKVAQSFIMALVRSVRSRCPKKDNGSLRICSARESLRMPLSL